ncbi:hypothetical protein B0H14DRAFT_2653842 [Mycena olivaceomarginata]|nr:hypothetical protein B0H14DRAFT_2653842 [Mycena olivaceomarginata]
MYLGSYNPKGSNPLANHACRTAEAENRSCPVPVAIWTVFPTFLIGNDFGQLSNTAAVAGLVNHTQLCSINDGPTSGILIFPNGAAGYNIIEATSNLVVTSWQALLLLTLRTFDPKSPQQIFNFVLSVNPERKRRDSATVGDCVPFQNTNPSPKIQVYHRVPFRSTDAETLLCCEGAAGVPGAQTLALDRNESPTYGERGGEHWGMIGGISGPHKARVASVCVTKKSENSRLCAKGGRGEKDLDEGGQ